MRWVLRLLLSVSMKEKVDLVPFLMLLKASLYPAIMPMTKARRKNTKK